MTQTLTAFYDGKEFREAKDAIWKLYNDLEEAERVVIPAIVRKALERYLKKVATIVATRNSGAWPSGTTPSSLSKRSGEGVASIHNSVRVVGGRTQLYTLRGYIGGAFYLRTHEFGAVIRARGNGWLTIPLRAALDNRGVPIQPTARAWANTFVQRSRAGNLLIFQKRGRDIVPLYVLKKEVRIPPRLGMSLTLDQFALSFLEDVSTQVRAEFMI